MTIVGPGQVWAPRGLLLAGTQASCGPLPFSSCMALGVRPRSSSPVISRVRAPSALRPHCMLYLAPLPPH
eukprot:7110208-Alexandrium_andersonii.AAC.1